MTPDKAQGIVVTCLAASGAIAIGGRIIDGQAPTFKQVAGGLFVALGLTSAAMLTPDLAAGMATLILTSAVFIYGEPVFAGIATTTTRSTTTTTSATAPAPAGAPTGSVWV